MGTYKRKSKKIKVHEPVSTLLIPDKLLGYFLKQTRKHGSKRKYFMHLLNCYSSHLKEHPLKREEKLTTTYQKRKQNLTAVSFRPKGFDWQAFKVLARMNGVSMTCLFVYLMDLELSGIAPKQPRPSRFRQKILKFCRLCRRTLVGEVATTSFSEETAVFHAKHCEKFSFFGLRMVRKGKIRFV